MSETMSLETKGATHEHRAAIIMLRPGEARLIVMLLCMYTGTEQVSKWMMGCGKKKKKRRDKMFYFYFKKWQQVYLEPFLCAAPKTKEETKSTSPYVTSCSVLCFWAYSSLSARRNCYLIY